MLVNEGNDCATLYHDFNLYADVSINAYFMTGLAMKFPSLSINSLAALYKSPLLLFIIIAIISTLLWLLGDSTLEILKYHRDAIVEGEYWRILTGHLVHSNGWHLLLNLASIIMIGLLFSQHLSKVIWIVVFVLSGLIISGCYYWIAPEFSYYVGLSAILYAVIIVGALLDIKEQPLIAIVVLLVVTARVIFQQFSDTIDPLAALIEDRVAIESHLFGICSGYGLGLILLLRQRLKQSS